MNYLDVRVRFYYAGDLQNFNLLSVQMHQNSCEHLQWMRQVAGRNSKTWRRMDGWMKAVVTRTKETRPTRPLSKPLYSLRLVEVSRPCGRRHSSSSRTPPIFPGVPDPLTDSSGRPQPDLAGNRTRNPVNRKACNIPLYHTGSSTWRRWMIGFTSDEVNPQSQVWQLFWQMQLRSRSSCNIRLIWLCRTSTRNSLKEILLPVSASWSTIYGGNTTFNQRWNPPTRKKNKYEKQAANMTFFGIQFSTN